MSIFAYFATATIATITIGGGGTALSFLSKYLTSKTTPNSLTQSEPESDLVIKTSTPDSHSSTSLREGSSAQALPRQERETQNLIGEGNCLVESGWEEKVIEYLPGDLEYLSVYCTNTGGYESSLNNWRGFLPTEMFVDKAKSLSKGDKFYIAVEGEADEEREDIFSEVQATFRSDQFSSSSFKGKWGKNLVEDIPYGENEVYVVELVGSDSEGNFYLQWLSA